MTAFAGYRFLLGPEQLFIDLTRRRRVTSPSEYFAWQKQGLLNRGAEPWDSHEPTFVRVNHGRWIADCVWCGTGMLTRPDWRMALCGECGARYQGQRVSFPKQHAEIEAILLRRVRRDQQNWDSTQDVRELEEENRLAEVVTP